MIWASLSLFFFFKYFKILFENFDWVWVNSFEVIENGEKRRDYPGMILYNLWISKIFFFPYIKEKKKNIPPNTSFLKSKMKIKNLLPLFIDKI